MESYNILSKHANQTFLYKSNTDPVTDIKDVPHHVLIVYGSCYCSGSLIGSRTVVTAASCFDHNKNEPVVVKVGSSSMTGSGYDLTIYTVRSTCRGRCEVRLSEAHWSLSKKIIISK